MILRLDGGLSVSFVVLRVSVAKNVN